jgi:Na+/glutamate symporter
MQIVLVLIGSYFIINVVAWVIHRRTQARELARYQEAYRRGNGDVTLTSGATIVRGGRGTTLNTFQDDGDDSFLASVMIGAATDNAMMGGMVGGSMIGGLVGQALADSNQTDNSYQPDTTNTTSTDDSSSDDNSSDSSDDSDNSYDNSSSSSSSSGSDD